MIEKDNIEEDPQASVASMSNVPLEVITETSRIPVNDKKDTAASKIEHEPVPVSSAVEEAESNEELPLMGYSFNKGEIIVLEMVK